MGLGVMMYIPSFIKIDSDFKQLIRGNTDTDRHTDSKVISYVYIYFSKLRKVSYKNHHSSSSCYSFLFRLNNLSPAYKLEDEVNNNNNNKGSRLPENKKDIKLN
jgi:hypothetical protein